MAKIYVGFNPSSNDKVLRAVLRGLIKAFKKSGWEIFVPPANWVRTSLVSRVVFDSSGDSVQGFDVCVFLTSPVGKVDRVIFEQITRCASVSRRQGFIVTNKEFHERKTVSRETFLMFEAAGIQACNAVHSYHCIHDWAVSV